MEGSSDAAVQGSWQGTAPRAATPDPILASAVACAACPVAVVRLATATATLEATVATMTAGVMVTATVATQAVVPATCTRCAVSMLLLLLLSGCP